MKCQEVMELMQRYVDGDLDQQETSLMMDHADQCSDCAAMLARLRKLSSELEQLPRVVPKFSIVDSILPELERLHAAGTAAGADETSSNSVPAPVRSNRPARHLFRKISGVVAAGIVVGLLLFSNPGEWLLPGGQSQNDAAMPNPAAAPAAQLESSAGANARMFSGSGSADEAQVQDQSGEQKNKSSASISGAESEENFKKDARSVSPGEFGIMENPSLTGDAKNPPVQGLSVPVPAADSPDAMWRAVAAEGETTLQVYRIEDGELLYSSEPKDGSIGQLEWNDDGTLLFFTVTDASGTPTQWQFDPATLKETKR